RWLTPDPYMGSMDLTNPQSLNRYAYVMNDPVNATDSTGLVCDEDCTPEDRAADLWASHWINNPLNSSATLGGQTIDRRAALTFGFGSQVPNWDPLAEAKARYQAQVDAAFNKQWMNGAPDGYTIVVLCNPLGIGWSCLPDLLSQGLVY